MRNIVILTIILWWVLTGTSTASVSLSDVDWDVAVSGTLYRGDVLSNGEYTVKATEFSSPVPGIKNMQGNIVQDEDIVPMVRLDIYKKGVFVREIVMGMTSESYIDPDYEVKISVTEFLKRNSREWVYEYYKPWAKVSIQVRAKPKLEVEIITDKDSYVSYDDGVISAKVKIINSGATFIKNVSVNLEIDGLNELNGLKFRSGDISQLHKDYYRMDKNTVQSFVVILIVPELTEEKSYSMRANVKGYDLEDVEYNVTDYSYINIGTKQDYLSISKALRDRIYLNDDEIVKITVANGGIYDIYNVSITDSMNENFKLEPNTSLRWYISMLKPGQEWSTTYSTKPLKANLNGFQIPVATARFIVNNRERGVSSGKTTVVVNGPIIVLNKTVNKKVVAIGEDVIVTVTINNVGNIPTKAEVKDSLPGGVRIVSGQMFLNATFLELNTPQRFSYTIRNAGNEEMVVSLPVATAHYTDIAYRGTKWSEMNSNELNITFKNIDNTNITNKSSMGGNDPLVSISKIPFGITGIIAIIVIIIILIFAFIYLRR